MLRRNRVRDSQIEYLLKLMQQRATSRIDAYVEESLPDYREKSQMNTILRTVQDFYDQPFLVARQHRESFLDVEEKLWKALIQFSHETFKMQHQKIGELSMVERDILFLTMTAKNIVG